MADNVDVTPGTGASIATDDVAGVQFQKVKVDVGGDGASSPLVRGAQTAANSLPVTLATNDAAVALLTTIDADTSGLFGTVSGSELQVDIVTSALPTGAATSAKQDTIIGHVDGIEGLLTTIDADTGTVAGAVSGTEMQVDVVAALPAGNNNIGDVDVASSALPTGASTAANQSTIIGHVDGIEGLLTTIDGDTGNLVTVFGTASLVLATQADDVANTADGLQTTSFGYVFDGTTWDRQRGDSTDGTLVNLGSNNDVTVTSISAGDNNIGNVDIVSSALPTGASTSANQTTIIGHLDGVEGLLTTIDADTGTVAGAVSGTEMQVDVVASLPAGTNNIGDVDVLSITPGTGATNQGKAVDAVAGATDTGVAALAVRDDALTTLTPVDGDYVHLRVGSDGSLWTHDTVFGTLNIAVSTQADDVANTADSIRVSGFGYWFDGTTWDRAKGDSTDGLLVNLGANNDVVDTAAEASLAIMDDWDSTDACKTVTQFATCTTSITRPSDTTAYTANDALSNSASSPTAGGFTFTSAARASGGSGIITDLIVVSSNDPATLLQGECWIYDSATTAVNDNAAFASSDSDTLLLVAVIPFTMTSTVAGSGTTSYAHVQGLSIGFTCSGSANLRFLVKVKNAYTPASAEVLSFRLKVLQVT